MKTFIKLILIGLFFISCSTGKLKVLADIPSSLKETSAIEKTNDSNTIWVIQDAGNNNHLYGLSLKGAIIKDISIKNGENNDWEDLTSDSEGNMYIGDFGNNNENRTNFTIYKISNPENITSSANASLINFTLPKGMNSVDFESFFLHNGFFYIFSKDNKTCKLIKVPNKEGNHIASYISKVKLKGKHTKVTSADISNDGKIVVLLNHDKLWKLTNYSNDDFFNGTIEALRFEHDSQKEGVNFTNNNQVLITDERTKNEGGNIYRFNLN
ncbi:hypothetical protein [Psychroserpens ponticola]|uniref:T9SS C-terminal target domain-containing protein n=1 Tax=Psychroserpens ponticola TaxID=2932268 RepID=A0ABY7RZY2_9FLAO|nr:hypothetical protein [Psychroserpens ponticola]WCO01245.1 hypothetical protein MUN68_014395 [Psychroserpens ponticola]